MGEGAIIVSVTAGIEALQKGSAVRGGAGLRPAAHSLRPFPEGASLAKMGGGEVEGGVTVKPPRLAPLFKWYAAVRARGGAPSARRGAEAGGGTGRWRGERGRARAGPGWLEGRV